MQLWCVARSDANHYLKMWCGKCLQGVVYWQPPKEALDKVKDLVMEPTISRYGADEGIIELREALVKKVPFLEFLR